VTELGEGSRPRLARGARLRRDRLSGKLFLLRPETGFELLGSASEVVKLCTAKLTVAEIVDRLAESYRDVARDRIAEDVTRLLASLAHRGLIVVGDDP
jgi:pyrroloquinoline quinone biosynthesis protein D